MMTGRLTVGPCSRMRLRVSRPSPAVWTSKPARRRVTLSTVLMSTSSSTTRIRGTRIRGLVIPYSSAVAPVQTQVGADDSQEFRPREGLGQVHGGPERPRVVVVQLHGGEDHNRNLPHQRIVAEEPDRLEAVEIGQHEVH